jgi:sortase (surface protein transpeptidase)
MSLQGGQAAGAGGRGFRRPPPRHRRPPKRRRLVQSAGQLAMGCGLLAMALGLGGWALTGQHTWFGQAGQRAGSVHPGQVSAGGAGPMGTRQAGSAGRRRHAGQAGAGQVPVPLGLTAHAPGGASQRKVPAPVRLVIRAIGVNTRLIRLGITRNNTLQVPGRAAIAGWFTGSPRPGAVGASIIAGHIDSDSGPGVFFRLRELHRGQGVYVTRANGSVARFRIIAVRTYAKDRFPTARVYGPVPDPELRLITCGGLFDYATGSYQANVVVYAILVH